MSERGKFKPKIITTITIFDFVFYYSRQNKNVQTNEKYLPNSRKKFQKKKNIRRYKYCSFNTARTKKKRTRFVYLIRATTSWRHYKILYFANFTVVHKPDVDVELNKPDTIFTVGVILPVCLCCGVVLVCI